VVRKVARQQAIPRKRRTREHVIAAQSTNYVERFIIDEGHTAQRMDEDYGYDLILVTYDSEGYGEPGMIYLQLKGAEHLQRSGNDYRFDIDIRDYHLWNYEVMPVLLVLFDASRRRAYWLHIQDYFTWNPARRPGKGVKSVRVRVPARQAVTRRALRKIRAIKQAIQSHLKGSIEDV
jgi:Domain of unknown function (DUF4365)